MLMSASSDFIALCQAQVALLTQGLGAALSVVYLTEELVEGGISQTKLVPVVAYPETAIEWKRWNALALQAENTGEKIIRRLRAKTLKTSTAQGMTEEGISERQYSLVPNRQIVLPLMQEGVLIGLLVTSREDRVWNDHERSEIEQIAQTIAIACTLDQRREWLEQQLSEQQRLQAKQRDLLDNLLHQFRNPLTALRTFGKLLLKRLVPGDANRSVADSIVRESDRLQELLQQFDRAIDLKVEDLEPVKSLPSSPLLLTAIQPTNKQLLLPNSEGLGLCSVTEVLQPLLESAEAIATERHLDLQAEIPANLPAVKANAQALREVLSNIIDNALKYTPDGGEIFIQAGLERGNFQGIAISDNGFGIPPQDLEQIFERHYRGVQAESEIAGTGLGLAIAKELIEQMQGEIQAFSPAQHLFSSIKRPGATFIVWLPLGKNCSSPS